MHSRPERSVKMSCDIEMLIKYPMIMQRQSSEEEYFGYVKVKGEHYKIHFTRNMKRFKLDMTEDLQLYESKIKKLSRRCFEDPVEYLDNLTEILSSEAPIIELLDHTTTYRKVLQEYSELTQFYINIFKSTISGDLKTINITQLDEKGRRHDVIIEVNYAGDGKMFKITSCDLPDGKEHSLFELNDSLISLYESFINKLECPKLQMVLDVLDEIDRFCWVLDPEKPSRKDLYRRIAIDKNVSVILTFNPSDVRDLPQIKFLGPHGAVKKYNDIINRNFINWNPNEDIFNELLKLLEIENFPSKPTETKRDELLVDDAECCICYSLRLNDRMPDVVCPNSSCNRFFHAECLYQWLSSLNSRKFYYEICGQCPNCEKTIHCPLPAS